MYKYKTRNLKEDSLFTILSLKSGRSTYYCSADVTYYVLTKYIQVSAGVQTMFVVWSNLHDQEVGIFGIVFQNIDNTRELLDVWWILELEVLGAFCFESIFYHLNWTSAWSEPRLSEPAWFWTEK